MAKPERIEDARIPRKLNGVIRKPMENNVAGSTGQIFCTKCGITHLAGSCPVTKPPWKK
jgi:hypothetical protein